VPQTGARRNCGSGLECWRERQSGRNRQGIVSPTQSKGAIEWGTELKKCPALPSVERHNQVQLSVGRAADPCEPLAFTYFPYPECIRYSFELGILALALNTDNSKKPLAVIIRVDVPEFKNSRQFAYTSGVRDR
jgi:hypothetical protein